MKTTEAHGHACYGYTGCGSGYPCHDQNCDLPPCYTCNGCYAELDADDRNDPTPAAPVNEPDGIAYDPTNLPF